MAEDAVRLGPIALSAPAQADFLMSQRTSLARMAADPEDESAQLGLAELYLSRGLVPEAASLLEGLETPGPRLKTLRAIVALLARDGVSGEMLEVTAGWSAGAALRVYALQQSGRFEAARELRFTALEALEEMPPELVALVLPTLLDVAIAAEDWNTGAALAAAFADHQQLRESPAYWLRLGQVAEQRGAPLTAFEGYLRASRGIDEAAHAARISLVQLGLKTGTLPRQDARQILELARYAWRGDAAGQAGLMLLAEISLGEANHVGAMDALAQVLRDFEDGQVRAEAQAFGEKIARTFYEEGAAGVMPLGAFLEGHAAIGAGWRLEPAYYRHARAIVETLLEAGMTAAAAREARELREAMTVAEELGLATRDPEDTLALSKLEIRAFIRGGRAAEAVEAARSVPQDEWDEEFRRLVVEADLSNGPVDANEADPLRLRAERHYEAQSWQTAHDAYLRIWNDTPGAFTFRDAVRLMIAARRSGATDTAARLVRELPRLADLTHWGDLARSLDSEADEDTDAELSKAAALEAADRAGRVVEATRAVVRPDDVEENGT